MPAFLCRRWPLSATTRCVAPALLAIVTLLAGGYRGWESKSRSPEPTGPVAYLAFSPDGGTVVAGSYWVDCIDTPERGHSGFQRRVLGVVSTWDVSTGRAVLSSRGEEREFGKWQGSSLEIPRSIGVRVRPDGRPFIYTEGGIQGGSRVLHAFTFCPDSQLVTCSGHCVIFSDESPRRTVALSSLPGSISQIAVSPDGRRVACTCRDPGRLKEGGVWDAVTGDRLVGIRPRVQHMGGLMFSPDGAFLVETGAETATVVWQAATGAEFRVLPYCTKAVFSQDSHLLAGLTSDTTVVVWDVLTGQEVRTCSGHANEVTAMAFDAAGKRLATGCKDGTVKVWSVP